MQTCVSIFALGIDVGPDFDQLLDRFDVFVHDGQVQRRATLLVIKVEVFSESFFSHLFDVFDVVGTGCLKDQLLLGTQVEPFHPIQRVQFKLNFFLFFAYLLG